MLNSTVSYRKWPLVRHKILLNFCPTRPRAAGLRLTKTSHVFVRDTGFEPVTSTTSMWRSTN